MNTAALDRYITGNWGEDSIDDEQEEICPFCNNPYEDHESACFGPGQFVNVDGYDRERRTA